TQVLAPRQLRGRIRDHPQTYATPSLPDALLPLRQPASACEAALGQPAVLLRCGPIEPAGVILQHPTHIEAGNDGHHCALGARDPFRRAAGVAFPLAAGVVEGDDLLLESIEDELRLEPIAALGILHAGGGNAPAVVLHPALRPPAVEDAQVQTAIDRGLDSRGAAGLERR